MEKPVKLNPQTWSQLPRELIEHILIFLPIKSLLNLRSTCKRFYTIIFSPSFISKHSVFHSFTNTNKPSSFLLLSHPQFQFQFPLYDFTNTHWRISGLPLSNRGIFSTSHLLSASNGLLCFSRISSSSLIICNLLTRSSKVIKFPLLGVDFDSVTLISSSTGYKIFVLCSGCSSNFTYIYDSATRNWSKFHRISQRNSNVEGVYCNGYLYFTTPEPLSVVRFDMKTSKWEIPIQNENLPGGAGELTFARLASNKQKLYLIGGIGSHGISRSMMIWELKEENGDWVETGSLPDILCRKFMCICYHNYQHVYCFYHEGVICVCCYTWPEILCYKIARQTWHWLPRCPSLPEKWSCGFRWFSFVPNFYALV